jgi:hypothetical protein
MPTPSIERKLSEVGRIIAPLGAVEHPGPLESPAPSGDLVALFEQRFNDLRDPADSEPGVIHVGDMPEAAATIAQLCQSVPRGEIIWSSEGPSSRSLPSSLASDAAAGGMAVALDGHAFPDSMAAQGRGHATGHGHATGRDFAVGVTPAVALIASTGSIVIEIADPQDAWTSLLVDRHIVVAGRDRLVPDLPTFYRELSEQLADSRGAGSAVAQPPSRPTAPAPPPTGSPRRPIHVCITGCSRTADIEKLLVIPAHGPRQVRVILCAAPVDWASLHRAAADPTVAR